MIKQIVRFIAVMLLGCVTNHAFAADPPGLITVPSNNSVGDTIQRFEDAVKASGWMVFARLDHAAAAEKYQQKLLPRTVIVYGNPGLGTANMVKVPTLAIDIPPKALVWQDDQGKVWLSYNSAAYLSEIIYARHGVPPTPPAGVAAYSKLLEDWANKATK
jgi:uncharacterized protein (DUF302 family)